MIKSCWRSSRYDYIAYELELIACMQTAHLSRDFLQAACSTSKRTTLHTASSQKIIPPSPYMSLWLTTLHIACLDASDDEDWSVLVEEDARSPSTTLDLLKLMLSSATSAAF